MMGFGYGGHGQFWQSSLVLLGILILSALIVWAFYRLMSWTARAARANQTGLGARIILDQRLAKGEIDATEFQRLRELISIEIHESAP
jgi:uncharacterized membrane protein